MTRKNKTGCRRQERVLRSSLWAGICLALSFPSCALCAETLLLEVSFNEQSLDGITSVERLDDGRLLLPAADWARARLKPASVAIALPDGRIAYALDAIPGLEYDLDLSRLTLEVKAPTAAFATMGLDVNDGGGPEPQLPPAGGYLDYDLSVTGARDGGWRLGALLEGVAFGGWGSLVSGLAVRSDESGSHAFRTDTYWRFDMPSRMQTLVVGDTISSAGGWSRPLRYGGIRIARDFDTAPNFITYPMPSITGSAALASTVDVLVNNRRSGSASVQPGPFELTNVPAVSGAGEIQLVVRDLLGRETLIRQSYYVTHQLLARGLSDFSYEAGMIREGYATHDDRYGRAFAAGTYRRGLSDWFTGEVRAEVERDRTAAGVSFTAVVGELGVVGLAAGWSVVDGRRGGHYAISAQRSGRWGGSSLSLGHFDREFRQFGASSDERQPRDQVTATVGARLGRHLTGGIHYTRQTDWSGPSFSLVGTSLGLQFRGGAFLGLSASRSTESDKDWSAGLNFVLPLGQHRVLTADSSRRRDGGVVNTAQVSQSAPTGPGWGWRVRASDDPAQRLQAEAVFNGNTGQLSAEVNLGSHNEAVRLGASGSIGHVKGFSFASRRIDGGAFAVVRVGDFGGVPISLSNQVVGVTNRKGFALVTGLLPYQLNRLSLDPGQLPMDAQIDGAGASAVPYPRSGAFVEFPVRRTRNVLLVLLRPDGSAVPAGARVSLGPGLAEFNVMHRGEVYLADVGDAHRLTARWQNGNCSAEWSAVPAGPAADASITLTCQETP
jgi:outer membrane usher protein